MRPHRALVLLLLTAAAGASPSGEAAAQGGGFHLSPGERVRLSVPAAQPAELSGVVLRWDRYWLELTPDGGGAVRRQAMHDVTQVEVLRALPAGRRARIGAAWGGFLGASAGGVGGPFVARSLDGRLGSWAAVAVSAGAGALLGSAGGAVAGALIPRRGWFRFRFAASAADPVALADAQADRRGFR